MKRKRFVLSGYFGFKNFGDEAILSILVNKLKERNASITIISSDPEYTKRKYKKIRSVYTFKISDIFGFIAKSDYLISGGGSLLQDATSLKSLIYYLLIILIGLICRKKVIIFAQGIGPISNPIGQYMTKFLLKKCTYISVRDQKSHDLLKKWGIESDLLCDPVFSTKIEDCEKKPSVAIQLRDFKTMSEDFIDRLALTVSKEFPDKNFEIFSFQDEIDLTTCQKFKKSLDLLLPNSKTTLYSNLTDEETIKNLSKCEYMIAMRFHALIIGLISKTKTLAINYDIKVEKLASEFKIPIIDLKKDFNNEFKTLKTLNPTSYEETLRTKVFNWTNFENTIK